MSINNLPDDQSLDEILATLLPTLDQICGSVSPLSEMSTPGSNQSRNVESVNDTLISDGESMRFGSNDSRCTLMLRRFPRLLNASDLASLIDSTGFLVDSYDLIYVPAFAGKNHNGSNRGYAFINFKSPELAVLFASFARGDLTKRLNRCDIVYAHIQGKEAMLVRLLQDGTHPPGLLIF